MIFHVPVYCSNFISTQQQGNILTHAKSLFFKVKIGLSIVLLQ